MTIGVLLNLKLATAAVTRPVLQLSVPGRWGHLSRAFWLWVLLAVALAMIIRAPWFTTPLGNDEGGLAYIGERLHGGGQHLFGDSFIDRPPLLLGAFRIAAETGGTAAVRAMGALTAALLVVTVALIARELGGRRAGIWAGFIGAVLASSVALGSVFTPAELLGALPSAVSVLLLLVGLRARRTRLLCFGLAGLLAVAALLVKQSFGDAIVAGGVCLAAGILIEKDNRHWLANAGAYVGGICVAVLCLELWELAHGAPDGSMLYALVGFRLDGLGALAGSAGGLPGRFADRLVEPLLGSGLALVLMWAACGVRELRSRPVIRATVIAWATAGLAGLMLGGSYWSHYLIELIPVAAVLAALYLSAGRRWTRVGAAAVAAMALAGVTIGLAAGQTTASNYEARAIGGHIGARAYPHDTIYVLYSQPNVTYYSGLRNPYPYNWSLMLRTIADAERRLRALLGSERRPSWIVAWEPTTAYGLDLDGSTTDLIREHYRRAGRVCGVSILVERGLVRPGPGPALEQCS